MSASYLVTLLEDITADCSLDAAYEWLCNRRKDYPEYADVWSLRFDWPDEEARIQHDLLSECYRFEPLAVVTSNVPPGFMSKSRAASDATPLLGRYVRRWLGWAHAGLSFDAWNAR